MKCLIYVTKSKWRMFFDKIKNIFSLLNKKVDNDLNGKIVAEFDGEVEEITKVRNYYDMKPETFDNLYYAKTLDCEQLSISSCMTTEQFDNYLKDKNGYAIHIEDLHVFDKPKELSDYYKKFERIFYRHLIETHSSSSAIYIPESKIYFMDYCDELKKAPQNMMYVYDKDGVKYVLISVHPEWACKILNGEKTIEVRKQVLNCMKGN